MKALLLLGALLGAAGCAQPVLTLATPATLPPPKQYDKFYDRWSRHGRIISVYEMDTVMLAQAILRSPEFEAAYLSRYLDLYQIGDPAARQRVIDEQRQLDAAGVRFVVRTAAHNYVWGDLVESRGFWRLVLVDDTGVELAPVRIEAMRSTRQPLDLALVGGHLPSLWPFVHDYHVTFPATRPDGQPVLRPGLRRLILRIAGPKGTMDLTWDLS